MKDPELDILIEELETRADMPVADFSGVVHALHFLLPAKVDDKSMPQQIATADGALLIADAAYPNWSVNIHGRTNDRNGHWRVTLRESDIRDNDGALGVGRSPVLAQAILAAVLRLAMMQKKDEDGS